jgi:hypothetical protein
MAPRWPYTVNTVVSLDSGPSSLIDMTDPSNSQAVGSPPTVVSQVLWGQSGLANTEHTLVMSMASSGMYVVVDALMYVWNDFLRFYVFLIHNTYLQLHCRRPHQYNITPNTNIFDTFLEFARLLHLCPWYTYAYTNGEDHNRRSWRGYRRFPVFHSGYHDLSPKTEAYCSRWPCC